MRAVADISLRSRRHSPSLRSSHRENYLRRQHFRCADVSFKLGANAHGVKNSNVSRCSPFIHKISVQLYFNISWIATNDHCRNFPKTPPWNSHRLRSNEFQNTCATPCCCFELREARSSTRFQWWETALSNVLSSFALQEDKFSLGFSLELLPLSIPCSWAPSACENT